jgi:hypothetical protein
VEPVVHSNVGHAHFSSVLDKPWHKSCSVLIYMAGTIPTAMAHLVCCANRVPFSAQFTNCGNALFQLWLRDFEFHALLTLTLISFYLYTQRIYILSRAKNTWNFMGVL